MGARICRAANPRFGDFEFLLQTLAVANRTGGFVEIGTVLAVTKVAAGESELLAENVSLRFDFRVSQRSNHLPGLDRLTLVNIYIRDLARYFDVDVRGFARLKDQAGRNVRSYRRHEKQQGYA